MIRDRLGVKPLYFYEDDDVILFASEAKVVLSYLSSFTLNYKALNQFIWFGNTTGNQTVVNRLIKIDPGTITKINLNNFSSTSLKYWNYDQVEKTKLDEKQIIEEIKDKLNNAVKRQLMSDVPLGVLISGGVDSSGLVAMAAQNTHGRLDTYSVDYDYNVGGVSELKNAAKVASMYDTNHHELRVTTNDAEDIFSKLVFQYDEPFADPASIPLYQLSKVCSNDKRVILQGDGGDELFAGYSRYNVLGSYHIWKLASNLYPLLFFDNRKQERLKRLNFILSQKSDYDIISNYLTVETPYKNPIRVFSRDVQNELLKTKWNSDYEELIKPLGNISKLDKLLIADFKILLTNKYLEKVDKATMLCSIESRVPYLDNDLVDFALSIPSELKIKGNEKKYLLKKALNDLVPNEILYGKKRGFDVPYREWLRKDLYGFFKQNIKESNLSFFDKESVLNILDIHKDKKADYGDLLWKVLVLSNWLSFYSNKIFNE
ncbi:asparagine synthase [Nitritalea halalkaliphila LW7]|uniref:asparagine synthase (glutamine-hydrolyzing) n=1 Tax=Nitritalea halalkaliphila LW7 TaxID=1189621 RepID=I5BTG2_9BACT|nr:asparagine synthase (glutamine-hydrolyzing) [Nitritalea halalkaliphila]EIM72864.1 asparagine synthase [Nitritalea halalkaliphila LW7]